MAQWRDSYRQPKLGPIDAKITFFILITAIHFTYWTAGITIAFACFLYFFERRRNMDFQASVRMLRMYAMGTSRPPLPPHKRHYRIDYERRD